MSLSTEQALKGGGEMGALMRRVDWASTPLGPVAQWPQSLLTAASILLDSKFPMYIAWGREYVQLYNDGYRPILGSTKHPAAMGGPASETFAESWHIIGPMFDGVRAGNAVGSEDWMLPLDRNGYLEECYFTFSYSPIRDESGGVGGVHVTVTETTAKVTGARRLRALHELAERTTTAPTPLDAFTAAASILEGHGADVPFALLYVLSAEGTNASLVASTSNLKAGTVAAPSSVSLDDADSWPLRKAVTSLQPLVVDDLRARFGPMPGGEWPEPAESAILLPIARPGDSRPYGVLVAGVSPRRALDKDYREFFGLLAGHVASGVTNARALEDERRRTRELAELDRAKTTFFSNVSHELRTPLTLLLGPAEDALAGRDSLPAEDVERWTLVHRNASRLARLVNTLLDFARIEAGRIQASYEATDLALFTRELASLFRSAVERAGLRLVLDLEPLDEPAYVDREMWEKIVLNLLSNALKFTFDGEIRVTLRRRGPLFELAVHDTGVGIAAEEVPRVFDRFHRARATRARTHEGTGIGLALVQELAKLHGGSAHVISVLGRGTTFRVELRTGSAHLPADRLGTPKMLASTSVLGAQLVTETSSWLPAIDRASAAPVPSVSVGAGKRARVLLADDNVDMRDYLARLLREQWDVETVADGVDALEAARRTRPDIVVSDVMMPRMDGFGLLKSLRDDVALRTIPVILLSARAGEEATAEGLEAGANDYLAKPFSARELLVRVAAQLAVSQVSREAQLVAESERSRLYTHFMQAPFPIAVLRGPSHVFELANEQALRVWGKKPTIIGQPLPVAFPELIGQPFPGYLDQVLRSGQAYEGKESLARLARGPNGALEDVYFNFVYAPLRDQRGVVEGILVCGYEITEQVVARRRSELAEGELRTLVNSIPELAWTARADGFIDFYNRRWYEYTGTTFEQMKGWGWSSVHDPELLAGVTERWTRSLQTGEPFEMEFPLRGADGIFRWFLTRVVPLRDADGFIVRWFGINTNIDEQRTARKQTEALLAEVSRQAREMEAAIRTMRAAQEDAERRLLQRESESASGGE